MCFCFYSINILLFVVCSICVVIFVFKSLSVPFPCVAGIQDDRVIIGVMLHEAFDARWQIGKPYAIIPFFQ